jgi:hypothetical protein
VRGKQAAASLRRSTCNITDSSLPPPLKCKNGRAAATFCSRSLARLPNSVRDREVDANALPTGRGRPAQASACSRQGGRIPLELLAAPPCEGRNAAAPSTSPFGPPRTWFLARCRSEIAWLPRCAQSSQEGHAELATTKLQQHETEDVGSGVEPPLPAHAPRRKSFLARCNSD